ncbi:MAG: polymerase subunit sigma-70 [Micavibrio sp.]|nr:polymerase subunit sigma-70 [Micavibrio sp.]
MNTAAQANNAHVINHSIINNVQVNTAFEEGILENRGPLKLFALRLTNGNQAEADDLVQETILRAIEKEHLFEPGTSFFKWGCKIMFNLFATEYRRKVRFDTQYDPDIYLEQRSVEPSQESIVDWHRMETKMKELPEHHREIISMICVNGLSYEEAAAKLNIEMGTVRSRLSRARENLTRLM